MALKNKLIDQIKSRHTAHGVNEVLQEIHQGNIKSHPRVFSTAVQRLASLQALPEMFSALALMDNLNLRPNKLTFDSAIHACAKQGATDMAVDLVSEMQARGIQPDQYTLSGLMKAHEVAGDGESALRLLQEAKSYGIKPDLLCYNIALGVCIQDGKLRLQDKVLNDMIAAGFEPSVETYTMLVDRVAEESNWCSAQAQFEAFQEVGVQPDLRAINTLLKALARDGQWRRARAVVDRMRASGDVWPCAVSYTLVMRACINAGRSAEALKVFDQWRDDPSAAIDALGYAAAFSACAGTDDLSLALDLFDEMRSRQVQPDYWSFHCFVAVLCQAGEWQRALAVLDEIAEARVTLDPRTFELVLDALRRHGRVMEAVEVVCRRMLALGTRPLVQHFNIALQALADDTEWEAAQTLFETMQNPPYSAQPDTATRNALMRVLLAADKPAEALAVHDQVVAARDDETFDHAITALARCGEWGEVWSTFRLMCSAKARGHKRDFVASPEAFATVLRACERLGMDEDAMHTLEDEQRVREREHRRWSFHNDILTKLRARNFNDALDSWWQLRREHSGLMPMKRTWHLVVDALEQREECELADDVYAQAAEAGRLPRGQRDAELDLSSIPSPFVAMVAVRHSLRLLQAQGLLVPPPLYVHARHYDLDSTTTLRGLLTTQLGEHVVKDCTETDGVFIIDARAAPPV